MGKEKTKLKSRLFDVTPRVRLLAKELDFVTTPSTTREPLNSAFVCCTRIAECIESSARGKVEL